MAEYKGIIPPLITPLDTKGNVSEKSIKKLIEYVRPYASALMPTLSSGEGWALDDKEFVDMIRFTMKYARGLPVLAGVECSTTKKVIERSKIAKKFGIDAIVITTPFTKEISQNTIYAHFKDIAEAVKMPIFVYNEKAISKNAISYKILLRICKLDDIVGIKEASGSAKFTQKLIKSHLGIPIFQGWEHLCYSSKGVDGYVMPLANIEPKLCYEMFNNPSMRDQKRINALCKQYNLLDERWYFFLKQELVNRAVIDTARTA